MQAAFRPRRIDHESRRAPPLRRRLRRAARPRAAKIMTHANVTARGPIAHPRKRGRLPAAVEMQHPRQLVALRGSSAIREDTHLHVLPSLAGESQLLDVDRALVPRLRDRDLQRLRMWIVITPQVLHGLHYCLLRTRERQRQNKAAEQRVDFHSGRSFYHPDCAGFEKVIRWNPTPASATLPRHARHHSP